MNHLKPVSDDAMSLLRTIIKLNVADVKEIIYILFQITGRGVNVKTAIFVEYSIHNITATNTIYIMYIIL